jgi:hypothetical protein
MSSIWNNFVGAVDRIGAMLGIRRENTTTNPTNPTNTNGIDITNSGAQQIEFPAKPDDWQDSQGWERYWNLRVKYPVEFAEADVYIQTFNPVEVEMIMKHVHEQDCPTISEDTYIKIISDTDLFKQIAEIRKTLEAGQSTPILIEYVKLDYVLESMPSQCQYSFKFVGVDTIYKS